MKNNILFFFLWFILFLSFGIQSCSENSPSTQSSDKNEIITPEYAQHFKIEKNKDETIIRILNPWKKGDVLQSLTFTKDISVNQNQKLASPVRRLSIHSLDNIGYLNELNALEHICAITDTQRVYNQRVKALLREGKIVSLGQAVQVDKEKLLQANPSLILSTRYESSTSSLPVDIPILYNLAWMETHPLGRAEWIKVIGIVVGKERQADSVFRLIEKNYNGLHSQVKDITDRPKVMVGSSYQDIWYVPGGGSYKAKLLEDAGMQYYWKTNKNQGSLPLDFETILKQHSQDDIWIEVPWADCESMLELNKRFMYFKAFKNKNVFNNFGRSSFMANDYWERGVCRPDIVLKDLVEIAHPEIQNHELIFYHALK